MGQHLSIGRIDQSPGPAIIGVEVSQIGSLRRIARQPMATMTTTVAEHSVLMTLRPTVTLGEVEVTGSEIKMGCAESARGLTDLAMMIQLYPVSRLQIELTVLELDQTGAPGQLHAVVDESAPVTERQ